MNGICLKILPTAVLLSLIVSCSPAGCYGPKSFGYNTKGVITSNLFGAYSFDGTNAPVLIRKGFTNHSGTIRLNSDMTFVCSNVPSIMDYSDPPAYYSTRGKWKIVPNKAIWEVELFDADFQTTPGRPFPGSLTLRIVGDTPPHGLELAINHTEGYYIRWRKAANGP